MSSGTQHTSFAQHESNGSRAIIGRVKVSAVPTTTAVGFTDDLVGSSDGALDARRRMGRSDGSAIHKFDGVALTVYVIRRVAHLLLLASLQKEKSKK